MRGESCVNISCPDPRFGQGFLAKAFFFERFSIPEVIWRLKMIRKTTDSGGWDSGEVLYTESVGSGGSRKTLNTSFQVTTPAMLPFE